MSRSRERLREKIFFRESERPANKKSSGKVQKTTAFVSERMRVYKVGLCVFPQRRTLANLFSFFEVKDQSNVAVFTFWPFSLLIICASVSLGNSRSCVDERHCDFWSWARK